MLDHVAVYVKDASASERFYSEALASLGYKVHARFFENKMIGFAVAGETASLWLIEDASKISGAVHFAFRAKDRREVDSFHAAGVKAGGVNNGPPGLREAYGPGYYTAFVRDLDGHNVEVVLHEK
ncbi:glyoxalase/bleomycin resistance protein/dioxygenase [Atractiella rhizophila]|nr:glyoxalase/bleomycin resistance protein/dioxygenase [Atractiella rhizophila]